MKFAKLFSILTIVLFANLIAAPAQKGKQVAAPKMQLIYDGTIQIRQSLTKKPSAAELEIINGAVRNAANQFWGDSCEDGVKGFGITEFASGAFTRPNVTQSLFLYEACANGHEFANNGIVVLENGKMILHVVFQGSQHDAFEVLPDINKDGRAELLLSGGGTWQGISSSGVLLLEISADGVKSFGSTVVSEDSCGAGLKSESNTAYKIYVQPAANPVFYREKLVSKNCRAKMIKIGAAKSFALEKDETKYEILK